MPVNLTAPLPSDLHPVPGVKLGITQAGVRKAGIDVDRLIWVAQTRPDA